MTDAIPCPTCQAIVPIEAQFCPGCGRPRTIVERRLRDEAKRLRVSYAEVLAFEQVVEQRRLASAATIARLEARLDDLETRVAAAPLRVVDRRPPSLARQRPVLGGDAVRDHHPAPRRLDRRPQRHCGLYR